MSRFLKLVRGLVFFLLGLGALGLVVVVGVYQYLEPRLPSIDSLKDVRFQVPLKIYTGDGKLMAEFGEKRRSPVRYDQVPKLMIDAFLAAEDDRFFQHPGVDYQGLMRAAFYLIRTGEKGQGGSTITMQVARNFFLTREKTYLRKLNEILLALKIDHELSKEDILDLYLNKIYLGNRAYGVEAAARVYYGKSISELNLAQIAMIAGLPKAPSRYNPLADGKRALERRGYVLGRMYRLGFIDKAAYQEAMKQPISSSYHGLNVEVKAPYVAEMVRADLVQHYGTDVYTSGFKVYTTLDSRLQGDAKAALRHALLAYDRRHGYRGPEARLAAFASTHPADWDRELDGVPPVGGLVPAIVTAVKGQQAEVYLGGGQRAELDWDALSWARRFVDDNSRGPAPKNAADVLQPGDVVRIEKLADGKLMLAEVPAVSGALVALSPHDGSVLALVGGFDYFESKFNRVTQARRQPGSNFKPFIYTAALDKGFTAASLINDAPVVFEDKALESVWRPENYSGKFFGPTRLREALVHSRNLVSIRLLRAIGVDYAIDYVKRFGFDPAQLPHNLSLALGSLSVTPLQLVTGYAVFANGGYRVKPYYISRIVDTDGKVVFQATPAVACEGCATAPPAASAPAAEAVPAPAAATPSPVTEAAVPAATLPLAPQVLSPQTAYLIDSMMRDVIRHGTGRRALALGRHDLAGKTGTTNDQRDAWFSGFNPKLVTTAWVGFDQLKPLGRIETGAHAALPMWMEFMGKALAGTPDVPPVQPQGLVTVRIDPVTGLLAASDQPNAIFETFRAGNVPEKKAAAVNGTGGSTPPAPEQLF